MKKKTDRDNQKLNELEKAEKAKEKANRTKIHIQSRVVMVVVTGGLCLIIALFGVYLAYKLRVNPDVYVSQPNSESVSVQSLGRTQETGDGSSSLNSGNAAGFGGTDSGNSTISIGSVQPSSQAVSVSGIPAIGGGGNVSFPPSGRIYESPARSVTTDEPNSVMTSADGNTHEPEIGDTQITNTTDPASSSQSVPSNSESTSGISGFSGGEKNVFPITHYDVPISSYGFTGEGFFN